MNNDLISREALKKAICIDEPISIDETWEQLYDAVVKAIDNAPTVDTNCPHCDSGYAQGYSDGYLKGKEARPHGKWKKHEWGYSCSVCGVSNDYAYDNNIHKFTDYFCPNCGAKMDGGEEE